MTGDSKPGDAVADKWRDTFEKNRKESDLPLTRLEIRAEQRSSNELEDTGVIHLKAEERMALKALDSDPPASKATPTVIVLTLVRKIPTGWGAVVVVLAGIAAYVWLHKP